MKIAVLVVTMFVAVGAGAQNCPNGFTTSGPCGVAIPGQASQAFQVVAPTSSSTGPVWFSGGSDSRWGVALGRSSKLRNEGQRAGVYGHFYFRPEWLGHCLRASKQYQRRSLGWFRERIRGRRGL